MNLLQKQLLLYTLLLLSFAVESQPLLKLCVSNPNGEQVTGIENLGVFINGCYQTEIQSSNIELCPEKNNGLMNGVDVLDVEPVWKKY